MRTLLLVVVLCPLGALAARAQDDAASAHLERAARLQAEGHAPESIMELRTALFALPPDDPRRVEIEERVGMAYLSEDDVAAAHESFVDALKSAKELRVKSAAYADAVAGVGFCLAREKGERYARARDYLRHALAFGPSAELRPRIERELARVEALLPFDPSLEDVGPNFRVDEIVFVGNRTDEDILRQRLPFSEGETVNARDLAAAKRALDGMGLFKSVVISTSPAASGAGAQVTITVKDGWYVIPLPFFLGGAGGGRGGFSIEERNARRRAESVDLSILSGESGHRVSVGFAQQGWSARLINQRRSYTENQYADGGFTAVPGLGAPLDQNNPTRFGFIADSYQKETRDLIVSVDGPLGRRFGGEVGFDHNNVSYGAPNPSLPGDNGKKEGNAFAALKYGQPAELGPDLGAILGFGLSGVDEQLRPLRRPIWASSGEIRWIQARKWTASSVPYGIGWARWRTSYSWGGRQTLSLSMAGGHGYSLPNNQLLPTGRPTALQGIYAREFRGDSAGGASLGYSRRLWATHVGYLQLGGFAEDARAWFHPLARDKQGVGASVFYRFWRFPVPLGVTYTYSLDDHNGALAAGAAGRF